jgi:hypothetical protein
MIIELIHEALIAHHFINALETQSTRFYCRESSSAIRFVILHELEELMDPSTLNAAMNQLVPEVFSSHPSFRKNCDLICVHHLKQLADFKSHEEKIFAIEEDPHFFKKYVLYYSDAEDAPRVRILVAPIQSMNPGAMMRNRIGKIRTGIQGQSGCAVAAAGERGVGRRCA